MGFFSKISLLLHKIIRDFLGSIKNPSRSFNLNFQIILSFFLKCSSIGLSLIIVPITLTYLGAVEYGLWVTLLSIINWLTLMDVGIGNGLRNRLTKSLVEKNVLLSKSNISNAYILLISISVILICFLPLLSYINLKTFFNIETLSSEKLVAIAQLFASALIIIFLLNLINQIFNAFQKTGLSNLASFLYNLFFIIALFFFDNSLKQNLFNVIFTYSSCMVISYALVTMLFFISNKKYAPSIILFDIKICKEILKLGLNFFLIQIAVLLIFSVDSILIIRLLGPEYATKYNIAYKIFSIPTFVFTIIINPFWSAFTEAYILKDFKWIKNKIKGLIKIMIIVVLIVILISVTYDYIIGYWLKNRYENGEISYLTKISFALFVIISIWNNIFSFFLNGIGKTKLQVITASIGLLINIPLAILLVKVFNLGIEGILFSMSISLSIFAVAGPIITYKILRNK